MLELSDAAKLSKSAIGQCLTEHVKLVRRLLSELGGMRTQNGEP